MNRRELLVAGATAVTGALLPEVVKADINIVPQKQKTDQQLLERWEATGLLDGLPSNVQKEHMAMVLENQRLHNELFGSGNLPYPWLRNSIAVVRRIFPEIDRSKCKVTSSLPDKASGWVLPVYGFWNYDLAERFKPNHSPEDEAEKTLFMTKLLIANINDYIERCINYQQAYGPNCSPHKTFHFLCLSCVEAPIENLPYYPPMRKDKIVLYYRFEE